MAEKEPTPAHCRDTLIGAIGAIGGSSPKACEFLLKERVVMGSLLLAFQPLHVALNPRVVVFGYKARESLRGKEVHQSLPGPIPKHTPLPLLGLHSKPHGFRFLGCP